MTDTNPPADRVADRIAEIRARLDAADTPGPWEIEPDEHGTRLGSKTRWVGHCPDCGTTAEFDSGDADLIANAPQDLAYLLDNYQPLLQEFWQMVESRKVSSALACAVLDEREGQVDSLVLDLEQARKRSEDLSARVEDLERQLAKARVDVDGWTMRAANGVEVLISSDAHPHGPSLLTSAETPVGAVLAFIADAAAEEVIGPDTLCPCGKVNDGTGSGYCSGEHFDMYDGGSDER